MYLVNGAGYVQMLMRHAERHLTNASGDQINGTWHSSKPTNMYASTTDMCMCRETCRHRRMASISTCQAWHMPMIDDIEHLANAISKLASGWSERVEYSIKIGDSVERRVKRVQHPALLLQLRQMTRPLVEGPSNGVGSAKPGSRAPGCLDAASLIQDIRRTAHEYRGAWRTEGPSLNMRAPVVHELQACLDLAQYQEPDAVKELTWHLRGYIRQALILLGHEVPQRFLVDTVCGDCGGALRVASDARSDVRCAGSPENPPCGNVYRTTQWITLLNLKGDAE